jgi:hypothetical protein
VQLVLVGRDTQDFLVVYKGLLGILAKILDHLVGRGILAKILGPKGLLVIQGSLE